MGPEYGACGGEIEI